MNKSNWTRRTGSGTLYLSSIWHPAALKTVRGFPEEVRGKIGHALHQVQSGEALRLPRARSMSVIATGVSELRIGSSDGIFRVFYFVMTGLGVLVFHAFQKKTQNTPSAEIKLAKRRLRESIEEMR